VEECFTKNDIVLANRTSLLLEQQVLKLQQHHNGLSRIRRTLAQPSPHKRS
jgi:hypothetical protein